MIGKKLIPGSTLGIVSPAGPASAEDIEKGINSLKAMGFKIKKGKHIYDKNGYLAGEDEARAQDLLDMFKDNEVDGIMCVRGGYGAMRILPYLDFRIIKCNPKAFIGFSDITVLLNYFNKCCGLITFHGPMVNSNWNDKETAAGFLKVVREDPCPLIISNPPSIPTGCNMAACVEGRLVGGNLSLISHTMGTPYEIDTKNSILFMEEVGEEPYAIDRMLTQLLLSGKLQQCRGIILGQFTDCNPKSSDNSLSLQQVFEDRLFSIKLPLLQNLMSGHSYPKLTLPIGSRVMLDTKKGTLEVLEPVVK